MLGPKKSISFYRVEGIITKVRDLQNQHLHPPFQSFQCSSSRVRVISALVHEANRLPHGKEHVGEKDL